MAPTRSKREIAAFGVPVSALFLSNFALGAVDTAAVARFGGIPDLAALAPGTAAMEYSCYVISSLTAVVFNQLATVPVSKDGSTPDSSLWNARLRPALGLGLIIGALHAICFALFARTVALACGAPPEVASRTASYLRWRALGAATFQYSSISSSAFFALKDSLTPLLGTLVAATINVAGDILLCPRYGIAGAAVATSIAQLGTLTFLRARLKARNLLTPGGYLPTLAQARELLVKTVPIGVVTSARTLFYVVLGRWACQLGVAASAAQQIASTIFWGSTSASAEPMSVAAQTFVPEQAVAIKRAADAAREGGDAADAPRTTTRDLIETFRRLYTVSLLWGASICAVVYGVMSPRVLRLLTPEADVISLVPRAPMIAICSIISPMLLSEGSLLGYGATVPLMRTLLACCAASVACGAGRAWRRLAPSAACGGSRPSSLCCASSATRPVSLVRPRRWKRTARRPRRARPAYVR